MHEFPVVYGCSGHTTSRRDYVQHNLAALERGRLQAMKKNKVHVGEGVRFSFRVVVFEV